MPATSLDLSRLPATDAQAQERYEQWRGTDPFPGIDPALLNSADLFDYIATTGMVHPFEVDSQKIDRTLKPASCGIRISGECLFWEYQPPQREAEFDLGGTRRSLSEHELRPVQKVLQIDRDGILTLPPNSIAYATLAPEFRLPDYIAARFNLAIKYVYRGLLVGTGPLVDPGFTGKLQIPLHNLTSTPCEIPASDAVLWMEFTKLSSCPQWERSDEEARVGKYIAFPARKKGERDSLQAYLDHANGGAPIVSSIPTAVEKASRQAEAAAQAAKSAHSRTERFSLGAVVTAAVLLLTLAAYITTVQSSTSSDADDAVRHANELETQLNELRSEFHSFEPNFVSPGNVR